LTPFSPLFSSKLLEYQEMIAAGIESTSTLNSTGSMFLTRYRGESPFMIFGGFGKSSLIPSEPRRSSFVSNGGGVCCKMFSFL
jgi:hypothetical protein